MRLSFFAGLILLSVLLCIVPVSADYVLQVEALTSDPVDGATNYFGNKPSAPTTTGGINPVYVPTAGTIKIVEIYDYSGTAGSNQAYSYYLRKNNTQDFLINTLSVSANERVFSNTTISVPVNTGDYFEIKRIHPVWNPNPATNIVGGYVYVNATTPGYALWSQALSNNPVDFAINYMGGRPIVPSTTAITNKIYVPAAGTITDVLITDYSGTAGTNQSYGYFLERDGGIQTAIMNLTDTTNLRLFNNSQLSMSVAPGNFIELKRLHPNWTTNPATNIVGAIMFVNTVGSTSAGYPIWVQALTSGPTDAQSVYFGNRPIVPSTTTGTNKIYIRQTGTIKSAEIYCYSGTAGTAENWTLYIRKNNITDYMINNISISASERLFKNLTMNIPVVSGDYIEIKSVQPTWATNPATTIYGGYVWLEYGSWAGSCPACPECPACGSSGYDTDTYQPSWFSGWLGFASRFFP